MIYSYADIIRTKYSYSDGETMNSDKELQNVIEIEHLNKTFGTVKAVNDLSFRVKKGELFAFLGVNGAGKSTTIAIMCGQLSKDSGNVKICGKTINGSLGEVSNKIGVVFQNSVLDQSVSVRDNLRSRAALYGIMGKAFDERLKELAELLDFSDLFPRTVGKLSGGQRRRIDIARAIIHKPEILILDEPTTGLDPQTRKLLWDVVTQLRTDYGMTVLLTTHYMEEAADADYIVIIDSGSISAQGTPLELKNAYTGDYITVYSDGELPDFGYPVKKIRDAVRINVPDTKSATKLITEYPECFLDYEITKGRMDDVFLAVTGKKLEGGVEK